MKKSYITRKEKIIISTVDLIDEIGIKELSIKEIAKRQDVTEASLYKHFKSKDDILLEVLNYYSKYDMDINITLNNNGKDEKENISTYFKLYSEYFENYPALTSILGCYDVLLYEENLKFKVEEIYNLRTEFIKSMVKKGQEKRNINDQIKAENLTVILFGTFERAIFTWRLYKYKFSLKEKTQELINIILKI